MLSKLKFAASLFVRPSNTITDELEYVKVKGNLFFLLTYILICGLGILNVPSTVKPALLFGTPLLFIGYIFARTRLYKLSGIISIAAIFLMCLIFMRSAESGNHHAFMALTWMTFTIFIASSFFSLKQVIMFSIFQYSYVTILSLFSAKIDLGIFMSWIILNTFFTIANIFTRYFLDRHQIELVKKNQNLEIEVSKRTENLEKLIDEKDILINELYHRTKNNMQIISSLQNIQMDSTDSNEVHAYLKKSTSRINAMSIVQDKLYSAHDLRFISLREYLSELSEDILYSYAIEPYRVKITLDVVDINIPLDISIPLGLVLNELLINSIKHADYGQETVRINISSHYFNNENLVLHVKDNGKAVKPDGRMKSSKTVGLPLIKSLVTEQLNGSIQFSTESDGLAIEIQIPYMQLRMEKTRYAEAQVI